MTRGAWSSARVAKPSISCREGGRRPDEQATRVGPSHQCELTHLVFKTTNGIVAVGGPPFAGHVASLSAWPAQGVTFAKWCEESCSPRLQLRRALATREFFLDLLSRFTPSPRLPSPPVEYHTQGISTISTRWIEVLFRTPEKESNAGFGKYYAATLRGQGGLLTPT